MPPELLPKIQHWDTALAQQWAQALKVSTEALSYALLDAQLIDQSAAKLIRSVRVPMAEKVDPEAPEYLNATQLNRRLQLLERGLSDYYVGLCFEAHKQGLISAGRLGEGTKPLSICAPTWERAASPFDPRLHSRYTG